METASNGNGKVLRLGDVCARYGFGEEELLARCLAGKFFPPLFSTLNPPRWYAPLLEAWDKDGLEDRPRDVQQFLSSLQAIQAPEVGSAPFTGAQLAKLLRVTRQCVSLTWRTGAIPKPISVEPRKVVWDQHTIAEWLWQNGPRRDGAKANRSVYASAWLTTT